MPLDAGEKLGPYEIVSPIASGGMGEVYKARDTRLDRLVAIKVLPEHLSTSPELRERFEREARAVSALNHPNICVLHDVGREGETNFLVMEYLEGETLADRLKRGPLSRDDTLRIGMAVADALAQAHASGIVHRDLKPGNVLLTKTGVKLLDFGLAARRDATDPSSEKLTAEQPLTSEGAVMGTLLYMAPEQLAGGEADERADVYALGAVLYEMATGVRYFEDKGKSLVPAAFEHLVKTCLAPDPDERRRSAHDTCLDLTWLAEAKNEPAVGPTRGRSLPALAGALVLGAVFAGAAVWKLAAPLARAPSHFAAPIDVVGPGRLDLAIARDGRTIVYLGPTDRATEAQLYRRSLEHPESVPIPDTEGAGRPFFSPDGAWVGFHTPQALRKVNLSGGGSVTVAEGSGTRDGSWVGDDIVFSDGEMRRVPAGGGEIETVPESTGQSGSLLPDGRHALFEETQGSRFGVRSIETEEQTLLAEGSQPRYASTGHVLFLRERSLWGVAFDLGRLELTGEPAPLLEGVTLFAVSDDGTLAYLAGGDLQGTTLVWVDRGGEEIEPLSSSGSFSNPELSPEGTTLAVVSDQNLWAYDLERGSSTRLTFEGLAGGVLWSPDGSRLTFSSNRDGIFKIYEVPSDGSGEVALLFESPDGAAVGPLDWSGDGRYLIYGRGFGDRGLHYLSDGTSATILDTEFDEFQARLSPDGRLLAYVSNKTGRHEVYLRSFPQSAREWSVSQAGGYQPRWSRDGEMLYYLDSEGVLVEVSVATESGLSLGAREPLFHTGIRPQATPGVRAQYDVSADGARFLINRNAGTGSGMKLHIVLDWFTELKEKVR